MDKFSVPNGFDQAGFLRYYFAVDLPGAYPSGIWLPLVTSIFGKLTESELGTLGSRLADAPIDRAAFVRVDRKIRGSAEFADIEAALSAFEGRYFCRAENGTCVTCKMPVSAFNRLCSAAFADPTSAGADDSHVVAPTIAEEASNVEPVAIADPFLDYFKIPAEPGEINGFEYDALIDSAPVIVWRPACELEYDFVQDIIGEAESAGVSRLFLIARTELGLDSLPINPNVALILLQIPRDFHAPTSHVIEADELIYS